MNGIHTQNVEHEIIANKCKESLFIY